MPCAARGAGLRVGLALHRAGVWESRILLELGSGLRSAEGWQAEGPRARPHCSGWFPLPSTSPRGQAPPLGGPGTTSSRLSAWALPLRTRPGGQGRCLSPLRPQPWPPWSYMAEPGHTAFPGPSPPPPGLGRTPPRVPRSLQEGHFEVLGYTCLDPTAGWVAGAPRRLERTVGSVKQKDPQLEQTPTEAMACAFPSGSVVCPGGVRPRQGLPASGGGRGTQQAPGPVVRCTKGMWLGLHPCPPCAHPRGKSPSLSVPGMGCLGQGPSRGHRAGRAWLQRLFQSPKPWASGFGMFTVPFREQSGPLGPPGGGVAGTESLSGTQGCRCSTVNRAAFKTWLGWDASIRSLSESRFLGRGRWES